MRPGTMRAGNRAAPAFDARATIQLEGLTMATDNKRRTGTDADHPKGSQPVRKSKQEDEALREHAKSEGTADAPMDPEDESFIKSK